MPVSITEEIAVYAGSGTHIISLSLPGFASLDQERVHCQVMQDAEGRRRLMVGADSTESRFAEAPVIKFRFRRNRVSVLVKTVPEVPGAEISIRGIEEHNRGIVI